MTNIQKDIDYLKLFQWGAKTIDDPCDKELKEGPGKNLLFLSRLH